MVAGMKRAVISLLGFALLNSVCGSFLPIGGPKEYIPEECQLKNLEATITFFDQVLVKGSYAILEALQHDIAPLPFPKVIPQWAPDIRGQFTPLGKYNNFEASAEYWFALQTIALRASFSRAIRLNPLIPPKDPNAPFMGAFTKSEFKTLFASANMVYWERHYHATKITKTLQPAGKLTLKPTLIQRGVFYFNRQNQICGYNVEVSHIGSLFRSIGDPFRDEGFPETDLRQATRAGNIESLYLPRRNTRTILEEVCEVATGPLCQQVGELYYSSKRECMMLLGFKRVGEMESTNEDTLVCRFLHRLLVPSNPQRHCKHLAYNLTEAEGGTCIDRIAPAFANRDYQCGYDDVGYVTDPTFAKPGYPSELTDYAPGPGWQLPLGS